MLVPGHHGRCLGRFRGWWWYLGLSTPRLLALVAGSLWASFAAARLSPFRLGRFVHLLFPKAPSLASFCGFGFCAGICFSGFLLFSSMALFARCSTGSLLLPASLLFLFSRLLFSHLPCALFLFPPGSPFLGFAMLAFTKLVCRRMS